MSQGRHIALKGVLGTGAPLATKGVLDGEGEAPEQGDSPLDTNRAVAFDTTQRLVLSTTPQDPVTIVVPTAHNICLLAAANIDANLRVQLPAALTLPSLYKRAFLVAYTTDELAVTQA